MNNKLIVLAVLCLTGCAGLPTDATLATPSPTPPPVALEQPIKGWTTDYNRFVETFVSTAMLGVKQAPSFCAKYPSMTEADKRRFWGVLFKAIAKQESGWNRTSRYHEASMGTDSLTKLPVYSEGLLQLSYSDTKYYPCPQIRWAEDKALEATDPRKTIFNANYNLYCGVQIVDKLFRSYPTTGFEGVMGKYWSVMRPVKNGKPRQSYVDVLALVKKEFDRC